MNVHQNRIGLVLRDCADRGLSGGLMTHDLVSEFFQEHFEVHRHDGIILDDQDAVHDALRLPWD